MKKKGIFVLFSTLLVLMMVVSPVVSTASIYESTAPVPAGSTESMTIRVSEDESVYSANPNTNYDPFCIFWSGTLYTVW